jgi:hypothetical protein
MIPSGSREMAIRARHASEAVRVAPSPGPGVARETPAEVVDRLTGDADLVVVVGPPLSAMDGLGWVSVADGSLLVVERDRARRQEVAAAAETLRRVEGNLLGSVLLDGGPAGTPATAPGGRRPWFRRGARADDTAEAQAPRAAQVQRAAEVPRAPRVTRASRVSSDALVAEGSGSTDGLRPRVSQGETDQ